MPKVILSNLFRPVLKLPEHGPGAIPSFLFTDTEKGKGFSAGTGLGSGHMGLGYEKLLLWKGIVHLREELNITFISGCAFGLTSVF